MFHELKLLMRFNLINTNKQRSALVYKKIIEANSVII